MPYLSTRDTQLPSVGEMPSFGDILMGGLAPCGGLYLPAEYPRISAETLESWRGLGYADLAFEILSLFVEDIPADDLRVLTARAYSAEVFSHARRAEETADITPLTRLEEGLYLLELSNGPTLAFKDIAMQLLGHLFAYELERRGKVLNILGATSGDTGSAAEYALRGKNSIRVFMLSPYARMSAFQRAQMYSLDDDNIHNIAVEGVFDQAQDIVKSLSSDANFKARYRLGTVNSINWGRLAAQTVYYFKAWLALGVEPDQEADFAVPSGNFGNICAGHIARCMGLPIGRLILATNENDVLDEFFKSGVYRPRGTEQTLETSSPSMDISRASNLERFIFDLCGRDALMVRNLWGDLGEKGYFDLNEPSYRPWLERLADFGFKSGRSTHKDRMTTIADVWREYRLLVDPHTADGLYVMQSYRRAGVPMVVLETAQAAKFSQSILEATGLEPPRPQGFEGLEDLPQHVSVLPANSQAVRNFIAEVLQTDDSP